jgi:hypothetical protein
MRIPYRHALLAALALVPGLSGLAAADPIATWKAGDGTIGTAAAAVGATIDFDVALTAGAKTPAAIHLANIPDSAITLAPGTSLTLHQEGDHVLVIALAQGDVQVDVTGQTAYSAIIVRGEAADVRITGTLFVVERVRHDENYVAMVHGKASVLLRRLKADGLADPDAPKVDLLSHQGVDASRDGGLGAVETLNNRPQIAAADRESIRAQGLADQAGDGGWNRDDASAALAALTAPPDINNPTNTANTPTATVNAPEPANPDVNAPSTATIDTAAPTIDVVNEILDSSVINNFSSGGGNASELVRASTVGAPVHPPVLGTYPGPPGP